MARKIMHPERTKAGKALVASRANLDNASADEIAGLLSMEWDPWWAAAKSIHARTGDQRIGRHGVACPSCYLPMTMGGACCGHDAPTLPEVSTMHGFPCQSLPAPDTLPI